eukprot:g2284.t1
MLGQGVKVKQIACGEDHCIALSSDGKVYSWGGNLRGQLGIGVSERAVYSPSHIARIHRKVSQIDCGAFHSVALLSSGLVYTWGSGAQLGLGVFSGRGDQSSPCNVRALSRSRVRDISCGQSYTAVVTHKRDVYTWGQNADGQLATGDLRPRFVPSRVSAFGGEERSKRISAVSCGSHHCAALALSGAVYTWGSSVTNHVNSGCLGLGSTTRTLEPRQVLGLKTKTMVQVTCGLRLTAAISDDGRIFAWGALGALGSKRPDVSSPQHERFFSLHPREISTDAPAVSIDAGFSRTMSVLGIVTHKRRREVRQRETATQAKEKKNAAHPLLPFVPGGKHSRGLERVKRLVHESEGSLYIEHVDKSCAWVSVVCTNLRATAMVLHKKTGNAKTFSLLQEMKSRRLEIIRRDVTKNGGERYVLALVAVEHMSPRQLRSVVSQLQSDETATSTHAVAGGAAYSSKNATLTLGDDDSSGENADVDYLSQIQDVLKPAIRKPSVSRTQYRLRDALVSHNELLEPPTPIGAYRETSLSELHDRASRSQRRGAADTQSVPHRASESASKNATLTAADRQLRRAAMEQPNKYVNWTNMSGLFDRVANPINAPSNGSYDFAKGNPARGLTVRDMMKRTSKQGKLLTRADSERLMESGPGNVDSVMQGNAAWTGLAFSSKRNKDVNDERSGQLHRAPEYPMEDDEYENSYDPSPSRSFKASTQGRSGTSGKDREDTLRNYEQDMGQLVSKIKKNAAVEVEEYWDQF